MKNLTSLFLFITIGFSLNGFSQLKEFDLTSYKLPDLERRSMETNFNMSGVNAYNQTPGQTNYGDRENGSNSYYGDIYLNYNNYLNNPDFQRESNMGLDFSSYFFTQKEDNVVQFKNHYITPWLYFQRDNRKYYKNKAFIETNLLLGYQYSNNKRYSQNNSTNSENKDDLHTHTVFANFPLKFGTGRIEPVQDARHAVYIIEELSKNNKMESDLSDEQIIDFARLISHLKNKRFFDSRLRRIAEIESVDSFFVANNYIKNQDAEYFIRLNDIWAFGNRPFRKSGTRFSGSIIPAYYYYNYNNPEEGLLFDNGKYNLSALLLDGGIEFKHEKPINLYWQNSIEINSYAGIINGELKDKTYLVENKIRIPNIRFGFYHTIGYYPNTRTDMSISYSVQYVQLFDYTDLQGGILGAEGKGAKASAELSINYYISPKFRLNLTTSFSYTWQNSIDQVIINFDNVTGSDYLLNNFRENTNGALNYYYDKEVVNNFRISLIYSVF